MTNLFIILSSLTCLTFLVISVIIVVAMSFHKEWNEALAYQKDPSDPLSPSNLQKFLDDVRKKINSLLCGVLFVLFVAFLDYYIKQQYKWITYTLLTITAIEVGGVFIKIIESFTKDYENIYSERLKSLTKIIKRQEEQYD